MNDDLELEEREVIENDLNVLIKEWNNVIVYPAPLSDDRKRNIIMIGPD